MKIINNTKVFEPSECIFCLDPDPDNPGYIMVCITDKAYWDENMCLNDQFGDHSLPDGAMPESFCGACDSMWETELPSEKARQTLIKAGFIESQELAAYIKRCNS